MAGDAIGITCGNDAEHDADHQREQLRRDHQQQGRGQAFHDQLDHGLVIKKGITQVQAQYLADIGAELHQERLIQPVILANLLQDLGVGAAHRLGDGVGHVARGHMHQSKS